MSKSACIAAFNFDAPENARNIAPQSVPTMLLGPDLSENATRRIAAKHTGQLLRKSPMESAIARANAGLSTNGARRLFAKTPVAASECNAAPLDRLRPAAGMASIAASNARLTIAGARDDQAERQRGMKSSERPSTHLQHQSARNAKCWACPTIQGARGWRSASGTAGNARNAGCSATGRTRFTRRLAASILGMPNTTTSFRLLVREALAMCFGTLSVFAANATAARATHRGDNFGCR